MTGHQIKFFLLLSFMSSQVEGSGKGSEGFQAELCKIQQLCEVLCPKVKIYIVFIKFIREKQGKVRDGQRRAEQEMVAQEVAKKELEEKIKWFQMILEVRLHNLAPESDSRLC